MTTPSKVFLSYANEDRDAVSMIYKYLLTNKYDPWMDVEKLLPGQDWELEIEIAIERSDFFIACLSTNSVDKTGFVQKELKKALEILDKYPEGKVYIIPARLNDCLVPRSLSKRQYLDWYDVKSRTKLLEILKKS